MTDAEIEVYGANIDEAFQNAGRAVEQMMVDLGSIDRLNREKSKSAAEISSHCSTIG